MNTGEHNSTDGTDPLLPRIHDAIASEDIEAINTIRDELLERHDKLSGLTIAFSERLGLSPHLRKGLKWQALDRKVTEERKRLKRSDKAHVIHHRNSFLVEFAWGLDILRQYGLHIMGRTKMNYAYECASKWPRFREDFVPRANLVVWLRHIEATANLDSRPDRFIGGPGQLLVADWKALSRMGPKFQDIYGHPVSSRTAEEYHDSIVEWTTVQDGSLILKGQRLDSHRRRDFLRYLLALDENGLLKRRDVDSSPPPATASDTGFVSPPKSLQSPMSIDTDGSNTFASRRGEVEEPLALTPVEATSGKLMSVRLMNQAAKSGNANRTGDNTPTCSWQSDDALTLLNSTPSKASAPLKQTSISGIVSAGSHRSTDDGSFVPRGGPNEGPQCGAGLTEGEVTLDVGFDIPATSTTPGDELAEQAERNQEVEDEEGEGENEEGETEEREDEEETDEERRVSEGKVSIGKTNERKERESNRKVTGTENEYRKVGEAEDGAPRSEVPELMAEEELLERAVDDEMSEDEDTTTDNFDHEWVEVSGDDAATFREAGVELSDNVVQSGRGRVASRDIGSKQVHDSQVEEMEESKDNATSSEVLDEGWHENVGDDEDDSDGDAFNDMSLTLGTSDAINTLGRQRGNAMTSVVEEDAHGSTSRESDMVAYRNRLSSPTPSQRSSGHSGSPQTPWWPMTSPSPASATLSTFHDGPFRAFIPLHPQTTVPASSTLPYRRFVVNQDCSQEPDNDQRGIDPPSTAPRLREGRQFVTSDGSGSRGARTVDSVPSGRTVRTDAQRSDRIGAHCRNVHVESVSSTARVAASIRARRTRPIDQQQLSLSQQSSRSVASLSLSSPLPEGNGTIEGALYRQNHHAIRSLMQKAHAQSKEHAGSERCSTLWKWLSGTKLATTFPPSEGRPSSGRAQSKVDAEVHYCSLEEFVKAADECEPFSKPVVVREHANDESLHSIESLTSALRNCCPTTTVKVQRTSQTAPENMEISGLTDTILDGDGSLAAQVYDTFRAHQPAISLLPRFQALNAAVTRASTKVRGSGAHQPYAARMPSLNRIETAGAFCGPHVGSQGHTCIRQLVGSALYLFVSRDKMSNEWEAFVNNGARWCPSGQQRAVILQRGDVLFMPQSFVFLSCALRTCASVHAPLWDDRDIVNSLRSVRWAAENPHCAVGPSLPDIHTVLEAVRDLVHQNADQYIANEPKQTFLDRFEATLLGLEQLGRHDEAERTRVSDGDLFMSDYTDSADEATARDGVPEKRRRLR